MSAWLISLSHKKKKVVKMIHKNASSIDHNLPNSISQFLLFYIGSCSNSKGQPKYSESYHSALSEKKMSMKTLPTFLR